MINLKNYNRVFKLFVIFLTFAAINSCGKPPFYISKIEAKRIPITEKEIQTSEIEKFISPYREHIDADLSSVLAYSPETLDKNGYKWQSPLGNLLANISLRAANKVFQLRENKVVDLCLLNSGGIRSILPKGNVTARTAFEIMPFENSLVVIALKGEQIQELVDYFIATKKAHPLAGLTFTIDKNGKSKNVATNGKPLDLATIYYVATNDYLANGGDNMIFFKKGIEKYDLDYKLRNVLIDYFKEVDTIAIINDIRISEE
jgi:2',3'-cyclic-nucleotide 2'-phosphodiesterase (5'-nucleotidase family)